MPTGRYTSPDGARKKLARYVDYVRDSYHLDGSAANLVDMKSLMAIAWQNNAIARGKDFDKSIGPKPLELCTACLADVAVDTIAIREIVINAIESDALVEHLKTFPNWGVSISPNYLDTQPVSASARIQDYIDVEIYIKLKSGKAQPIHLVAGWDDTGRCYIPIRLAMPRSGPDRPLTLF